eukprot:15460497-Alexandrium_andersonii.AAC.1
MQSGMNLNDMAQNMVSAASSSAGGSGSFVGAFEQGHVGDIRTLVSAPQEESKDGEEGSKCKEEESEEEEEAAKDSASVAPADGSPQTKGGKKRWFDVSNSVNVATR